MTIDYNSLKQACSMYTLREIYYALDWGLSEPCMCDNQFAV